MTDFAPRERHPGDVVRVGAGALLIAVTASWASVSHVSPVEQDIFRVINVLPNALRIPMEVVTQFGRLYMVGVAVVVVLLARRVWCAIGIAAAGVGAYFASTAGKHWIGRGRPADLMTHVITRSGPFHGAGYPSGHSAVAAAAVAAAVPYLPRLARRYAWTLAILVGFSRVYLGAHLPLDVVGGIALGWVVGAIVNLAIGTPTHEIAVDAVRRVLEVAGTPVATIEPLPVVARNSTPFVVTTPDGRTLFVKAIDREHRDSDVLYQVWRSLTVRHPDEEGSFASARHEVEHEALAASLALRAGVHAAAPVVATQGRDGPAILAVDRIDGSVLGEASPEQLSDAAVTAMWKEVASLRGARIAHGQLTCSNIMLDHAGQPWLIDFDHAEIGADDRRLARDVAELLASQALTVGIDRAVAAAVATLGKPAVAAALPLIQPLALSPTTRHLYRKREHHGMLDKLRDAAADAVDVEHVQVEPLARVHLRTIITLVGLLFAINLLIPQFGEFSQTLAAARHADGIWLVFAVAAGLLTYVGAALSLSGSVLASLAFGRTYICQLASSFTNKITPAGLGGASVNVRYLQRCGVSRSDAVGAVALNGTTGLLVHVIALALSAVLLGNVGIGHVKLPSGWTLLVLVAVLLAVIGIVIETSFGRRRIVAPTKRTAQDLVAVLRQPRKAAQLLGGSLLVIASYVLALGFALIAFHAHASWLKVLTVYLGGSAVASAAPTPGKVGAVEAALIAGLTGVGIASAPAVAGVLAFRVATFWLPILPGWLAFRSLSNRQLL